MKRITTLTITLLFLGLSTHAQGWQENEKAKVQIKPGMDVVTLDGKPFTHLIRGETDRFGEARLPYFYPVIGPTGAEMTRGYPMVEGIKGESKDHPHHQSLWFAHGNINGIDFWHDKRAKVEAGESSPKVHAPDAGKAPSRPFVSYHRTDTWRSPDGKAVLLNNTAYAADQLEDGSRVLELWHNITPAEGTDQLTFGDTKEGTMGLRLHPALRLKGKVATGKAINSEGVTGKAMWGKRAKWVAYWGQIDGETCGVAIFDHPTNLRHPTWWHARDYGLVAANPFGISDFERKPKGTGDYTLKQGETLNLRYRFVFFAGTAEEAKIAEKYERWVKETTTKKKEQ